MYATDHTPASHWANMHVNFAMLAASTEANGDPDMVEFMDEMADNALYMYSELSGHSVVGNIYEKFGGVK